MLDECLSTVWRSRKSVNFSFETVDLRWINEKLLDSKHYHSFMSLSRINIIFTALICLASLVDFSCLICEHLLNVSSHTFHLSPRKKKLATIRCLQWISFVEMIKISLTFRYRNFFWFFFNMNLLSYIWRTRWCDAITEKQQKMMILFLVWYFL